MAFDMNELNNIAKDNNVQNEPDLTFDEQVIQFCTRIEEEINKEDFENWLQIACKEMLVKGKQVRIGYIITSNTQDGVMNLDVTICNQIGNKYKTLNLVINLNKFGNIYAVLFDLLSGVTDIDNSIANALVNKFDELTIKHLDPEVISNKTEETGGEVITMIKLIFNENEEE